MAARSPNQRSHSKSLWRTVVFVFTNGTASPYIAAKGSVFINVNVTASINYQSLQMLPSTLVSTMVNGECIGYNNKKIVTAAATSNWSS